MQLNYTIKFHAMKGMKGRMRESAFFYWNFLGNPVFANNFMESKVRLNSVLEMYHCMEDCFCLGKQSWDRVALCLMCLLISHSTFNSSQNVPVWAGLFWSFPSMPVPELQSGYQAQHTQIHRQRHHRAAAAALCTKGNIYPAFLLCTALQSTACFY